MGSTPASRPPTPPTRIESMPTNRQSGKPRQFRQSFSLPLRRSKHIINNLTTNAKPKTVFHQGSLDTALQDKYKKKERKYSKKKITRKEFGKQISLETVIDLDHHQVSSDIHHRSWGNEPQLKIEDNSSYADLRKMSQSSSESKDFDDDSFDSSEDDENNKICDKVADLNISCSECNPKTKEETCHECGIMAQEVQCQACQSELQENCHVCRYSADYSSDNNTNDAQVSCFSGFKISTLTKKKKKS